MAILTGAKNQLTSLGQIVRQPHPLFPPMAGLDNNGPLAQLGRAADS